MAASHGLLVDLFGRIEAFFGRLEIYTGIPPTLAMMEKMVEITVEVLNILAAATQEMKQSRTSEFVLHQTILISYLFRKVYEESSGADGFGGWDEDA